MSPEAHSKWTLTFYNAPIRFNAGAECYWFTAWDGDREATCFVDREQAVRLCQDIVNLLGLTMQETTGELREEK